VEGYLTVIINIQLRAKSGRHPRFLLVLTNLYIQLIIVTPLVLVIKDGSNVVISPQFAIFSSPLLTGAAVGVGSATVGVGSASTGVAVDFTAGAQLTSKTTTNMAPITRKNDSDLLAFIAVSS
jgi:hypothetical protein